MDAARERKSDGRSPSVLTVQRSTPQSMRPVAAAVRDGCDAETAATPATASSRSETPMRSRVPMLVSLRRSGHGSKGAFVPSPANAR